MSSTTTTIRYFSRYPTPITAANALQRCCHHYNTTIRAATLLDHHRGMIRYQNGHSSGFGRLMRSSRLPSVVAPQSVNRGYYYYSTTGGGEGSGRTMAEVIARAIVVCNFDPTSTPFTPEDVNLWIQGLIKEEGVQLSSDLDQEEAPEILKRVGIKNAKLRNAILREVFPPPPQATEGVGATATTASTTTATTSGGEANKGRDTAAVFDEDRWEKLVQEITKLKQEKKWFHLVPKLMKEIDRLQEVQDESASSPESDATHPFYLPCLYQELAQAQFNAQMYENALESNGSAMAIYSASGDESIHRVMEALEFQGVIYAGMDHVEAAAISFQKILEWAEQFGKNSNSPIESNTARELIRTCKSHLGSAMVRMKRYQEAEELLSSCLALNAEANDFMATLRTLRALMACFLAQNDLNRHESVLQRALLWCDRHKKPDIKAEILEEEEERKAAAAAPAAAPAASK